MLRRTTLIALALLPIALVALPTWGQSGRGWVNGFVDAESATHPLKAATVELRGAPDYESLRNVHLTTTTDAEGKYALTDVPFGMYSFRVSAPGFDSYEIRLFVAPDMLTQIHVLLLPTSAPNNKR